MLHFLAILALCIFIGERLVRWWSPRMVLALGGTALVLGGGIFLTTILWPATPSHRPCETATSTYQEFIAAGRSQSDAEFLARTGAGLGCHGLGN